VSEPRPEALLPLTPEERDARWRAYAWRLIPAVPRAPQLNMALDEALTLRVGRGSARRPCGSGAGVGGVWSLAGFNRSAMRSIPR